MGPRAEYLHGGTPAASAATPPSVPSLAQILIIASDPREDALLRNHLVDWEGTILTVESGARGVAEARAGSTDLVILSYALGAGLESLEACRRLQSIPLLADVPIVMCATRPVSQEEMQRAYEAGCEAFVDSGQIQHLRRIVRALLRQKEHIDELHARVGELGAERRGILQAQQRCQDAAANQSDEGASLLVQRELAAGHPDGVLVVDADAVIRRTDRGARDIFGTALIGRTIGSVAPSSGLAAFVSNAHTEPREGFRFDHASRRGAPVRSILASVLPLIGEELRGARAVLLVDVGKRRMAAELGMRSLASLPRPQYYDLVDAARAAYSPHAFIGRSVAAARVRAQLSTLAQRSSGGVLLRGEPGTGLRLCARILHYGGQLPGPFLYLRCAGPSATYIERELFGWTRGALPDVEGESPGLLQLAAEGSLFLEGIEALPLDVQGRLAEAFETGSACRLGNLRRRERCVTRVLASTHADLDDLARKSAIHSRLARRLSPESITVPPLRERREDIDLLVHFFLQRFGLRRAVLDVGPEALALLRLYDWPVNVAELADCLERACEQAGDGRVETQHLTRPLRAFREELPSTALADGRPLSTATHGELATAPPSFTPKNGAIRHEPRAWDISDQDPIALGFYEMKALLRAIDHCGGDKLKAAKLLQLGKSTIYRKLKEYGLS